MEISLLSDAIDRADLIILASPVYVMQATGSVKAFLDYYGYRWMSHRLNEAMFSKQGVCISTASGSGMKHALKVMADISRRAHERTLHHEDEGHGA